MSEHKDVRCEICGKKFGDGDKAYKAAVRHVQGQAQQGGAEAVKSRKEEPKDQDEMVCNSCGFRTRSEKEAIEHAKEKHGRTHE